MAKTTAKPVGRGRGMTPVDVNWKVRTTRGERVALDALIDRWAADRAGESGIAAPGDGPTLWFRLQVRRLAAEAGIAIVEPGEEAQPPAPRRIVAPVKAAKKTAKKGAAKQARKPAR